MTFLGLQACVAENRLGIYGTSYGGATVVWSAAIDARVKCVVSCVGIGNGARWMRSVRRPDEWVDLLARSKKDREARVLTGKSEYVERSEVLLPDRQSAELAAAARKNNPNAINTIPLEYIDETLQTLGKQLAMHIAAAFPLALDTAGLDPELIGGVGFTEG